MKIHIITRSLNVQNGGGSHLTLDLLLRYLAAHGHSLKVTALSNDNNTGTGAPYTVSVMEAPGGFLKTQKHIKKIISESETQDLILLYGPSLMWGGGMYRKKRGETPVVVYVNNYTSSMGMVHPDLQGLPTHRKIKLYTRHKIHVLKTLLWDTFFGFKYVKSIDAFLFDSPIIEKQYEDFGYPIKASFIIPEFIDVENLTQQTLNSPFEKDASKLHLFYNGRLNFDKGVDMLIEVLNKIRSTCPDIVLHIVGSGKQAPYLESLVNKLKLTDMVHLYGWTDQQSLYAWYEHTDVFVHPCRWPEPFGRTIVEAMAFGKVTVVPSGTGSAWVADDSGIVFLRSNKKDLAEKISNIYNHRELLNDYSEKAKSRAKEFDYRLAGSTLERTLNSITTFTTRNKR